jgi:Putative auto-transporter adhesin, head GIN domain
MKKETDGKFRYSRLAIMGPVTARPRKGLPARPPEKLSTQLIRSGNGRHGSGIWQPRTLISFSSFALLLPFRMRTFPLFRSVAVAAVFSVVSVAAGQAQQLRAVGAFDKLRASGACDVVLVQGATTQVKVQAESDVEKYVVTEVQNGTLHIYRDKKAPMQLLNNKKVTVYVTCPRLSGIETSGASDIKSESTFTADSFSIRASGASDVTLRLDAKTLTVEASGASDIKLAGRAERQQVRISGSSDYRAADLQSRTADVQASGASDASVFVEESLNSRASGSSDVRNKGKARVAR